MKISCVIPVYNSGQKLRRCVDSLIAQDFHDFECVLVDDGSTDESAEICDEYSRQYENIRVIHKTNGGVSSARNAALDCIKGEWIVFVDSDDYVMNCHLSSLLAKTNTGVDWIMCNYYDVYLKNRKLHSYQDSIIIGKEDIASFISNGDLNIMVLWDKMFRYSIIKDHALQFDTELSISEDRLFCYQYMMHIRGIATTGKTTYFHDCDNPSSLSKKAHPFAMLRHRCERLSAAMHDLLQHYSLRGDDTYPFVHYEWGIFKYAILEAYSEGKRGKDTIALQKQLYSQYFEKSFFSTSNPKILSLIATREDRMIARGRFFQLYFYIYIRRFFFK